MKINSICILCLIFLVSCKSITVDSVSGGSGMVNIDTLYISSTELKSDDNLNIEDSFSRTLAFSLTRRNFKTALYMDAGINPEAYRYHAQLNIYVNSTGDLLDAEVSSSFFLQIVDSRSRNRLFTVRLSCRDCDLRNAEDQEEICERIAEKLDNFIKG